MSKVRLTMAVPAYDRFQALANGTVIPEGIDLNVLLLDAEEAFWRQVMHSEFDVSEASFSQYTMLRDRGDERFIAIPVFSSRFFRHSCIFINKHKGITRPEDLKGKVIGAAEYTMSAAVWLRGIFVDDYGVYPSDITWMQGGVEEPGRVEKLAINLPPGVQCKPIGPEQTLSKMLDDGEIDALFTARSPSCFTNGSPNVTRLFPNFKEVESDYFRRTGIFPMMHTMVIKRERYIENPWLAMSLFKAVNEAKDLALKHISSTVALYSAMPWIIGEMEYTKNLMGADWWPYGIDKNRKAIETFLRYHHEQGLSEKLMTINDLFAPETFDSFKS